MNKIALSAALVLSLGVSQSTLAHPTHSGYLTEATDHNVYTGFGGCWKVGSWTTADGTVRCGHAAPAAKTPAPTPVPAPVPAPTPEPKPQYVMQAAKLTSMVYFDFNSSRVNDVSGLISQINSLDSFERIILTGHTDQMGSNSYNDILAQKRVNAVAEALKAAGVPASKIVTSAQGESVPVKTCADSNSEALKSCLAANRRVEATIVGKERVLKN
ncbi:MAG: OmpA family protein [Marinobacterium sp.]|nr:OmpA family protein [Marinobacterium sp.]